MAGRGTGWALGLAAATLLAQLAAAQQAPQSIVPPPSSAAPQSNVMPPSSAAPQPPQAAEPVLMAPPPQTAREPRGFIEAIGRWFDEGTVGFRTHVQGAQGSIDEFNRRAMATSKNIGDSAIEVGRNAVGAGVAAADVTREAVGAVARLPGTRVVIGRERCTVAANGAPDCQVAADALCRKQGYATGKSMDYTSAESCPARVYLHGRVSESDCTTITFISRAMCQ